MNFLPATNPFLSRDINIDLLKHANNAKTATFWNQILSYGFLPTIAFPTRLADNSATLIDNIFTNRTNNQTKSYIIFDDLSDHLPILLNSCLNHNKLIINPAMKMIKRIYSADNFQTFESLLQSIDWFPLLANNPIFNNNSPNTTYEIFHNKFLSAFDAAFPQVTVNREPPDKKSRLTPPWLTKSIIKACHKKSRLLKIYKKTKTPLAKNNYTKYKNMLKQLIRKKLLR